MKFVFALAFIATAAFAANPEWSKLTTLDGKTAAMPGEKPYKLVVFWATWCSDCKTKLGGDLPEMNQRADMDVVTINTDRDAERAQNFVDKEHLKLPVLADGSKDLRKSVKAFSVPHWALYKKAADAWTLVESKGAFDRKHIEGLVK